LKELAAAANAAAKSTQEQAEAKAESNKKAQVAEDELKVALRQEIGQGSLMFSAKMTRLLSQLALAVRLRQGQPT
jgi:hypothetical protein